MIALFVALFVLAMSVAIQSVLLRSHRRLLTAQEQAFRFHAIRDELELMAVNKEISPNDQVFEFVRWTTNVCIQGAGKLTLREALRTVKTIESSLPAEMRGSDHGRFVKAIERRPESLQKLVGEMFFAMATMLVANDFWVRFGLHCAKAINTTNSMLHKPLLKFQRIVDSAATLLSPTHSEAVSYAREYSEMGHRLVA
ncbi:MAG: hypothetical protein ABIR59_04510 [Gemmatimonadales bacterium]